MFGLFWCDFDPKTGLEEKLRLAAAYFQKKHGQEPVTCYVNLSAMAGESTQAAGMQLVAHRSVLPNHFILSIESEHSRNEAPS